MVLHTGFGNLGNGSIPAFWTNKGVLTAITYHIFFWKVNDYLRPDLFS